MHEYWMRLALEEAKKAYKKQEVPVGAVIVREGELVSAGHNLVISRCDCTSHAEMNALKKAQKTLGNWRLTGLTLYVTIEPCFMCMGALLHARLATVVFGARDEKFGGAQSLYSLSEDPRLNHQMEVVEGVLAQEAADLMRSFFIERRKKNTERCPSG